MDAHKLLTTILSLTNYCQEVFRPRLKFPGWAMCRRPWSESSQTAIERPSNRSLNVGLAVTTAR